LFLFYNEYKEKMFTIEKEDERKAPFKPIFVKNKEDVVFFLF